MEPGEMRDWRCGGLLIPLLVSLIVAPAFAWWDIWPNLEHQALISRSIDIAVERYPDMALDITTYRDQLLYGVHDEDFNSDTLNGSYCDYSGYCAALPEAWWPTATRRLNAIQWVHDSQNPNCWDSAVAAYDTSRLRAYYRLGHILHNLQDLFIPAHSHIAPHGSGTGGLVENHSWPAYCDNFEQWCEVTSNELNLAQPGRIPEAPLDTLMVEAARFSSTDNESAAFYPSKYYAIPDAPGAWGKYRPYPYKDYPCGFDSVDNNCANAWSLYIVPRCCEIAAAAIRTYYLAASPRNTVDPVPTPGFRIDSPIAAGSTLHVIGLKAPATLTLTNGSGQTVARLAFSPSRQLPCPSLPVGTYICRVTFGETTLSQPIVIIAPAR